MLAMSDINIDQFLPLFADVGVSVAFLVPTPTGYEKSIMDAIGPVRELLKDEGIHDYEAQEQGPSAKVMWPAFFVTADGLVETEASLYRPVTKKGDPTFDSTATPRTCCLCSFMRKGYMFSICQWKQCNILCSMALLPTCYSK